MIGRNSLISIKLCVFWFAKHKLCGFVCDNAYPFDVLHCKYIYISFIIIIINTAACTFTVTIFITQRNMLYENKYNLEVSWRVLCWSVYGRWTEKVTYLYSPPSFVDSVFWVAMAYLPTSPIKKTTIDILKVLRALDFNTNTNTKTYQKLVSHLFVQFLTCIHALNNWTQLR